MKVGCLSVALVLASVLSTGVEAASCAWLATYAERSHQGLAVIIAAPTCLWSGLLISRVLGSLPGAKRRLRRSFRALLILVGTGSVALQAASGWVILLGAFGLGFGLGPMYPILLARVPPPWQGGGIFFLCGVASALMPLLVGLLSTHFASLQAGLLLLTAGALLPMLLGLHTSLREMGACDERPPLRT